MSLKSTLIETRPQSVIVAASLVAVSAILMCSGSLAQTPSAAGTTSIERGSEAEKALKLKEPSFETREERLKAKPLNWKSTIGKPKPKSKSAIRAEQEALREAKPETSESAAPDPNAEKEARRLHPNDWDNVK